MGRPLYMGSGGMRVLECLEPDLFSEIGILDQPGLDVQYFIFYKRKESQLRCSWCYLQKQGRLGKRQRQYAPRAKLVFTSCTVCLSGTGYTMLGLY